MTLTVKDPTFHYTKETMVQDLLLLTPFDSEDSILDAGSGHNKVWYKNFTTTGSHYECELEDGHDFFQWTTPVDWIVGNPPFNLGWKFLQHASTVAIKGIAFLGNHSFLTSCLPSRLEEIKNRGFTLQTIHIVQDKRWFGRYYYLIFTKTPTTFLSWNIQTYK